MNNILLNILIGFPTSKSGTMKSTFEVLLGKSLRVGGGEVDMKPLMQTAPYTNAELIVAQYWTASKAAQLQNAKEEVRVKTFSIRDRVLIAFESAAQKNVRCRPL